MSGAIAVEQRDTEVRRPAPAGPWWAAAWVHFGILSLLAGWFFAVVAPPFWGHDEITQFGRAYQVSQGGFAPLEIADDRGVAYGGAVPTPIEQMMAVALGDYGDDAGVDGPLVDASSEYEQLGAGELTGDERTIWFTNTAAYSPVPYAPAAVAIAVTKALGGDAAALILAARLAGTLAYTAIVLLALRALRGRGFAWLGAVIALTPIATFQAGTVTADSLTNAIAIAFSVLLVKAVFLRRRLGRAESVAIWTAAALLPLCKPTYVVLAVLVLLIPGERLGWTGGRRVSLAVVVAALAAFAAWTKLSSGTTAGMGLMRPEHEWDSVVPADQVANILGDPAGFAGAFIRTFLVRDNLHFNQFFGELGFAYIQVPATAIIAWLAAASLAAGLSDRFPIARRDLILVSAAVVANIGAIYLALYLSFTPVGYPFIDGVQGRYFVPVAVLAAACLLAMVTLRLRRDSGAEPKPAAFVAVGVLAAVSLAAAAGKYAYFLYG